MYSVRKRKTFATPLKISLKWYSMLSSVPIRELWWNGFTPYPKPTLNKKRGMYRSENSPDDSISKSI